MSQPIVILRHDANANADDVETIKAAGILVLRVDDPSAVTVLSAQSVVANDFVFRALLDMYQSMKGYEAGENKARFANALVGYVRGALTEPTP